MVVYDLNRPPYRNVSSEKTLHLVQGLSDIPFVTNYLFMQRRTCEFIGERELSLQVGGRYTTWLQTLVHGSSNYHSTYPRYLT